MPPLQRRQLMRFALAAALPAAARGAAAAELLNIETIQSAPFGHVDAAGHAGGMMFEIGNLIAERAGLPARNVVVPYARTVVSLRNGTADLVIRFGNEELAEVALQVARVLTVPVVALSLAAAPVQQLAELAGATVAVARSAPLDPQLAAVPGIHFERVQNNEMSVRMLAAGRVRAAFGSRLGLLGAARQLDLALDRFAPPLVLGQQEFWMHLSRRTATPAVIDALRRALDSTQRDGSLERIQRRYETQLQVLRR